MARNWRERVRVGVEEGERKVWASKPADERAPLPRMNWGGVSIEQQDEIRKITFSIPGTMVPRFIL